MNGHGKAGVTVGAKESHPTIVVSWQLWAWKTKNINPRCGLMTDMNVGVWRWKWSVLWSTDKTYGRRWPISVFLPLFISLFLPLLLPLSASGGKLRITIPLQMRPSSLILKDSLFGPWVCPSVGDEIHVWCFLPLINKLDMPSCMESVVQNLNSSSCNIWF